MGVKLNHGNVVSMGGGWEEVVEGNLPPLAGYSEGGEGKGTTIL